MSSIEKIRFNTLADCKLCCSNLFSIAEEVQVCEIEGCELLQDCSRISPPDGAPENFRDFCEIGRDFRYMGFSNIFLSDSVANVCNKDGNVTSSPIPINPTEPFFVDSTTCDSCCIDLNEKFDAGTDDVMTRNNCREACDEVSYCFDIDQHDSRMGCAVAMAFLKYGEVDFRGNVLTCNSEGKIVTSAPTLQLSEPTSEPSFLPTRKPTFSPSFIYPSISPSRTPMETSSSSPTKTSTNEPVPVSTFAPSSLNLISETNMLIITFGVLMFLMVFISIAAAFARYKRRKNQIKEILSHLALSSTDRYQDTTYSRKRNTRRIESLSGSIRSGSQRNNLVSNRLQVYSGVVYENDDGEVTQISF